MNENNRPDFENRNGSADEPLFEGKLRREAAQHRETQARSTPKGASHPVRSGQEAQSRQSSTYAGKAEGGQKTGSFSGSPDMRSAFREQGSVSHAAPQSRPVRRPAPQNQPGARPMAQNQPDTRPMAQNQPDTRPMAPDAQANRPRPVRPVSDRGAVVPSKGAQAVPKNAPEAPVASPRAEKPVAEAENRAPAYAARRSIQTGAEAGSGSNSKPADKAKTPPSRSKNTKEGADMMTSVVKGIVYIVLVLVVSVFISVFAIRVGNDVFAFVKSDEAVDITIPENANTADVARILADNGIIKYPSVFKIYASLKHESGDYLAGDYTVSPSMSYDKLRGTFKKQIETGTCWITIPEGYTTDEIIDLMVENGIGTREGYIDVINNYDFDYWFIDELEEKGASSDRFYRLDGYLFPDSYEFYKASSEATVINKLLCRFDEVFVEDYRTRASQLGYSADQIVTLASLVEKEAGSTADFMYVSSVFNNRLKDPYNFPRLESDATVVYAIQINTGVRPKEIIPEDLKYDSPYNTYTHDGLTPGPITNPSASAIRYALYPADTNYRYFVSADNGTTLFAATRYEHEENIRTVKQMNEQK